MGMMQKISALILLSLASKTLLAFDVKPWLNDSYDFSFESAFAYSWFSKVEGARIQPRHSIHDRNLALRLGFVPFAIFDVQFEAEFAKTDAINWALRSGATQLRVQFFDDISGDPLSLTCGLAVRGATGHLLKSVATPYASELNLELSCAMGKEWSSASRWVSRIYGTVAVGQGNRGYPWTNALACWQYNLWNVHRFSLFTQGYFGFGGRQDVNVNRFRGWGHFQHQSIDIGAAYGYRLSVYGTLSVGYFYRPFARNYPQDVHRVFVSYSLPFSLL